MPHKTALRQVKVLTLLFLLTGFNQVFATGNGNNTASKTDSSVSSEIVFLKQYSKVLGYNVDTSCNQTLISTVATWLGTPYRRAGYSKAGIDCSGFVSKIYKEVFGLDLTHSSSAMIYQMKERVKKSELKEGDILFFRIHGKRISHVGLYLGDNKFIHASTSRGIVVDDLRSAYYVRTYYTAGRPEMQSNSDTTSAE